MPGLKPGPTSEATATTYAIHQTLPKARLWFQGFVAELSPALPPKDNDKGFSSPLKSPALPPKDKSKDFSALSKAKGKPRNKSNNAIGSGICRGPLSRSGGG